LQDFAKRAAAVCGKAVPGLTKSTCTVLHSDLQAAPDARAVPACLCLQDFAKRAAAVCGKDVPELTKSYSDLQATQAPFFCLDLSFCHTVLTQGFDLSEAAPITLVKQVG
jgi:hypothetical protein